MTVGERDSMKMNAPDRETVYAQLRRFLRPELLREAVGSAGRLYDVLPRSADLPSNVVMVAFGGGKDSSYTLAFVRTVQLLFDRIYGATFRLRVVTNRHSGLSPAVMRNIDRGYRALGLYDDADCELLLVDGEQVSRFDVDLPQREQTRDRNRMDVLMSGHRSHGDGRPTFCNACNFSMVDSYLVAVAHGDGVDVVVTGDSLEEQRAYMWWVHRLARRTGVRLEPGKGSGFQRMLSALDAMRSSYVDDIHGPGAPASAKDVGALVPAQIQFFSIYTDTSYSVGEHWELLTDFLGFRFDEAAFNFTESDCGNPALMAHLRGLKCERVYGRTYAEGMAEYVDFALSLMREKEFPEHLMDAVRRRYTGTESVRRARTTMDAYALDTFGLSEEQLICMVYSPFVDQGAGLESYLRRERADLLDQRDWIHRLLRGDPATPDLPPGLAAELERVTGLPLDSLQLLYRRPLAGSKQSDLLGLVLAGDPHKKAIRTRRSADGPEVTELISGR